MPDLVPDFLGLYDFPPTFVLIEVFPADYRLFRKKVMWDG
jgi:hypothetical protein